MTVYMLAVHTDYNAAAMPSDEEMQAAFKAVDEFNQELMAKNIWVFGGGLNPPSTATVVNATGAEVITTDGPYVETKESLGGFWVVRAADLDEALALAARASKACNNPVEVRPFQPDTE
jgi:hypothetical protein